MQIKTTMTYHFTQFGQLSLKPTKTKKKSHIVNGGKCETLCVAWGNVKWYCCCEWYCEWYFMLVTQKIKQQIII